MKNALAQKTHAPAAINVRVARLDLLEQISDCQRRFATDAADEFIGECRWLLAFIDGSLPAREKAYLSDQGVHSLEDAYNWIGFPLPRAKHFVSYYQPGEFGNTALWGVTVRHPDGKEGACAFFVSLDDALKAYPEAVRL